jgi:hypothetical protein
MLVLAALHTFGAESQGFVKTDLFTAVRQALAVLPRVDEGAAFSLVIPLRNRVIRRSFLGCGSLAFLV